MDEDPRPAKRRRTSPRLSGRGSSEPQPDAASIEGATTTLATDASTTFLPDSLPQTTDNFALEKTRIQQPSFASPTHASLARQGPTTFERRQSVPRASSEHRMEVEINIQPLQSSLENEREPVVRPLAQPAVRSPMRSPVRQLSPIRPLSLPALRSPVRVSSSRSGSPMRRQFNDVGRLGKETDGLFGAPPQKSPGIARHRQTQGLAGSAIIASSVPSSLLDRPPRRSPIKPVPRPLPPPDPQRSQDLLEPLVARDRQRSALDIFRVREEAQPEPELPPTPENVDTAALNYSPPGIHFSSTPTKRPRRAAAARMRGMQKVKSGTVQSSSPLKQPPFKAATIDIPKEAMGKPGALREASVNVPTAIGRGRPRKSDAARKIQPLDENAPQLRKLNDLRAEIAELEADLAVAEAENARIRDELEQNDHRHSSKFPPNHRELISLLRRRVLPEDNMLEPSSASKRSITDWLHMAKNPIAFLPFGKPRVDWAEFLLFPSNEADSEDGQQLPTVSHHPIEMTAAEELPFLQVFTPLAFRSDIVIVPGSDTNASEAGALQKHIITASSNTPPGVFLARIEMTVHSRSLRITDLAVPRIEPPAAAAELKPLINRVTRDDNGSSALTRNITVLTWAMGEWLRVAVRRAKFWSVLARKLQDKPGANSEEGAAGVSGLVNEILRVRTEQRRKKRRKGNTPEPDEDSDNETNKVRMVPVSQVELLEHLGRTAMDFAVTAVSSVRVEWDIQFDWTGEAQSRIALLVGVPGKWRKADKRGRLARLPKLFDQLVKDSGDPMEAVQTAVALLVGEDEI